MNGASDTDSDVEIAEIVLLQALKRKQLQQKKKRLWNPQWLLKRREENVAYRLVRELREEDPATLRQWIRLDLEQYQELLALVTSHIEKEDTNMPQAMTAHERLAVTLCYLATDG